MRQQAVEWLGDGNERLDDANPVSLPVLRKIKKLRRLSQERGQSGASAIQPMVTPSRLPLHEAVLR